MCGDWVFVIDLGDPPANHNINIYNSLKLLIINLWELMAVKNLANLKTLEKT